MGPLRNIISAMESSSAYPHDVKDIKKIITGVSVIFLTGEFAYKINKPMNLGFLDFSTLEKRKDQCEKEVKYNSLITPELYLGVVTINRNSNVEVNVEGDGEVIEYAIKMKQMDPDSTMNNLLSNGKINEEHIQSLAKKVFSFHNIALTNPEISKHGNVEAISYNWKENFDQTEIYKEQLISNEDFNFIQEAVNKFIDKNKSLFNERVFRNKIKHCHGDFHSSNVFIVNDEPKIFDGIVFNQRFPCSDVIAEIAFMAMDLDFHNREDLAGSFIQEYINLSHDSDIPKLIDFYKCYRAFIRAKINCFTMEDENLNEDEKVKVKKLAQNYFLLAKNYAKKLV